MLLNNTKIIAILLFVFVVNICSDKKNNEKNNNDTKGSYFKFMLNNIYKVESLLSSGVVNNSDKPLNLDQGMANFYLRRGNFNNNGKGDKEKAE